MMSGQFIGASENSVHKNRLVIPTKFTKKFSEEAKRTVVVTLGPQKTIAVFPLDSWNAMLEKLQKGGERERTLLSILVNYAMEEQELEGPGRIRISDLLLRTTDISSKVFVKGELHYISLWNPDKLNEILNNNLELHDKTYSSADYHL